MLSIAIVDHNKLSGRLPSIDDAKSVEINRLALQQLSISEISRRTGVSRQTVRRVLERTRAALQINEDLAAARAESVALLRECQRLAFQGAIASLDRSRSPAAALSEARLAEEAIGRLLGVEAASSESLAAATFAQIVTALIREEAPELAPRLAARLRLEGVRRRNDVV